MLEANGVVLSRDAMLLTQKFCPGPITIIVPDAHGAKTGYRIPDHAFILALLKRLEQLASTSANLPQPNAMNAGCGQGFERGSRRRLMVLFLTDARLRPS
jgi:tRNA A37 threonylcarbamoyladenosine synthetase subunit TsaC/SUA5/YrdC